MWKKHFEDLLKCNNEGVQRNRIIIVVDVLAVEPTAIDEVIKAHNKLKTRLLERRRS